MKKILQKSLASMVSAALCLTAFVGCLTVNAETGTGTFTVKSQSAKPGASVIVPVEIMSDDASKGLAAAIFDVTFDSNVLTPTAIAAPSANLAYGVDYRTSNGNEIDVKVDTKTGLGTIRVLASLKDSQLAPVKTGMIANITFTVADTAALGVTAITLSNAQACNYGTVDANGIYANDEDLIAMATVGGTVTVESAVTHTHTWKFVSGTPAVENGANGTINFKCACGKTKTVTDVTYLKKSGLASPDIACTATTQLYLKTSIANYSGATAGYLTVTHHYGNGAPDSVEVLDIKDAEVYGTYYLWKMGVKSIHFSDSFTTVFYTERDGAWVSGLVRDVSIKAAAMSTIKNASIPTADKKVAADLLKMGAEAQKCFNYNVASLADSELVGDYAQYVTTTVPSVVKDTSSNFITVDSTPVKNGEKLGFASPVISLGDSVSINLKVVTKYYTDLASLTNLKMVLNYTSFNGAVVSTPITEYTTNSSGQFEFNVSMIAPNMRVPVSIQLFNGDTAVSDVATFSVEGVLAHALISNTSYTDLISAIINYSDSAQAAF